MQQPSIGSDIWSARACFPIATSDAATRLFTSSVTVTDEQNHITGTPAALEAALGYGDRTILPPVPSFVREWCRLQDSNLRPPHYECDALPAELKRLDHRDTISR